MAARTGRQGTLTAARAAGGMLAAVALSAGALYASTLSSSPPASAVGSSGKSLTIITEHVPKVGTVLATKAGMTLYDYTVDPAGRATCIGACAKAWPPLLLPKGVTHVKAPRGVKGLTAVRVQGGRLQLFFHDHALYRFVSDSKKGQAAGQGVANEWFAVLSSGKSSASKSAATPTSTGGAAPSSSPSPSPNTAPDTTSPSATKTPGSGSTAPSPTTVPPVAKSPSVPSTPPTTAPPTTAPPTTAPPTATPPTSPPTTTTTAPPTGGVGF